MRVGKKGNVAVGKRVCVWDVKLKSEREVDAKRRPQYEREQALKLKVDGHREPFHSQNPMQLYSTHLIGLVWGIVMENLLQRWTRAFNRLVYTHECRLYYMRLR